MPANLCLCVRHCKPGASSKQLRHTARTRQSNHEITSAPRIVAMDTKAYAFCMRKNSKPSSTSIEGRMKLIAILMFIAAQKQSSLDIAEQLLSRLTLPGKD